jgi:sugar phosphate isomerase/epimerase
MLISLLMFSVNSFASNTEKENPMAQSMPQLMPKLSVQLWSVRDVVKSNFTDTLQQLDGMGFAGVEFAGEFGEFKGNASAIKKVMDKFSLLGSGAHISFEQLNEQNFAQTVKFYQTLGIKELIIGWEPKAWHNEGVKEVVILLNTLAEKLAPYGMKIGIHNHHYEMAQYGEATYWDFIAKNTVHAVILQQDVGWTRFAGLDPVEYVKRYPGRTLTTHYKVALPENSQGQRPFIGQDDTDWHALLKANIEVGNTQWIVVEQEEYPDGLSSLAAVKISKQGLDNVINTLK